MWSYTPRLQLAPVQHADPTRYNSSVKGVPAFMLRHKQERSFARELSHWNAYVRVSEGELDDINKELVEWNTSVGCDERVLVGLLYRRLRGKFSTEKPIVQSMQWIEPTMRLKRYIGTDSPEGTHKCNVCGRMQASMRDAKYHCKWFKKKKR